MSWVKAPNDLRLVRVVEKVFGLIAKQINAEHKSSSLYGKVADEVYSTFSMVSSAQTRQIETFI